ncbi:MAG: molybdopterin-dependent oxidoreductase, partial [Gemmataceae bacterium]|nr:molybdopterin-dependent oxidoreductase [Gemmataceae bacterium]
VDLAQVHLEHAPPDDKLYANPLIGFQATGGSNSVRGAWEPLRRAGASARSMLVSAACATWNVDSNSCRAEKGEVIHVPTGRKLNYGALVDKAATLPVPDRFALKDPKDFKLIGKPAKRLDGPDKVNGKAEFSIDVRVPGMKIAAVAACPVFGGKLASVDEAKAKALKGVHQVVRLDDAVAVVAEHMWAAKQGLAALDISWDEGPNAELSTADIVQQLEAASQKPGAVARKQGDVAKAMAGAAKRIEAVYQVPFLAHATMEPMNCTVHARKDGCDVWVGTQVATRAQAAAAQVTGLPPEKIRVHNHLLGGGFGRRLEVDFITQAVHIAKQVDGPVKVIWTREEDIQHDIYRRARERHPNLRLILVPRQRERFDEVARLLERGGLPFVRRSALDSRSSILDPRPSVVLVDTIGELGALWGLADVAFVGGSLDGRRGGQNMIEPAAYGAAVLFGPHVWNFREPAARLVELGAAVQVADAVELESAVRRLLADPEERARLGMAARRFVHSQQGATERTVELLGELIGCSPPVPLAA